MLPLNDHRKIKEISRRHGSHSIRYMWWERKQTALDYGCLHRKSPGMLTTYKKKQTKGKSKGDMVWLAQSRYKKKTVESQSKTPPLKRKKRKETPKHAMQWSSKTVGHAHFRNSSFCAFGTHAKKSTPFAMPCNKLHPYVPSTNKEKKREMEATLMRTA